MAREICDDLTFDAHLGRIMELWDARKDTFEMAAICGITEAQAAYILECCGEGNHECFEEG